MRYRISLALSWMLVLTAVVQSAQASEPSVKVSAKTGQAGNFVVGEPLRCQNLIVFPVSSKVVRNEDRYITLDEGLKAGTVQVSEVGVDENAAPRPSPRSQTRPGRVSAGSEDPFGPPAVNSQPAQAANRIDQQAAEVNRLIVVNRSDKPLYLMPGEIIYGGQQDRTIGEEAVIPANGKPVAIRVYCVEHGRWAYRAPHETAAEVGQLANASGQTLTPQQLQQKAAAAQEGKFVAPAGSLHKKGRLAVQDSQSQSDVWAKVGEANAASGAMTRSGAFSANYTNLQVSKQIQGYVDKLQAPVNDVQQVIGAIVAIDGKVEAADVFQSTPLFRKLWPKLLKSYALDAATAAGTQPKPQRACTVADARSFLQTVLEANVQKESSGQGGLIVTKRESQRVVSFSAAPADAASGYGMGGGFGGVHTSGYSK